MPPDTEWETAVVPGDIDAELPACVCPSLPVHEAFDFAVNSLDGCR